MITKPYLILKIGGGKNIRWDYIAQDIVEMQSKHNIIVILGANQSRDEIGARMGVVTKRIVSPSGITSVYTSEKDIDIMLMAYKGMQSTRVVATFAKYGIRSVGISGVDGFVWNSKRKTSIYSIENGKTKLISDSLTGKVVDVNTHLINLLLQNGYIPVICSPAIDENFDIVNVDNDSALALMSTKLCAKNVVFLIEAKGLLKDYKNENSVVPVVRLSEIEQMIEYGVGGMKRKLLSVKAMLENNVPCVYYGDGRKSNPIISALNKDGTTFIK